MTNNIAIDTICAGIKHYKKFGIKVTEIRLSNLWFILFTEWMKEFAPDIAFDDEVEFRGTVIRRGTKILRQNIAFFTKQPTAQA